MISQELHRLLIILFMVTSYQVHAQDINRCTDLKTRKIIFSSEPCDPQTQRLVKVYEQKEMDKRLSIFDGAALLQKQKSQPAARPVQYQQPQQQRTVDLSKPHRDKNRCIGINREKESIAQRQRGGYTASQGEWFRARLRQLSDEFTFYQCSGFDS